MDNTKKGTFNRKFTKKPNTQVIRKPFVGHAQLQAGTVGAGSNQRNHSHTQSTFTKRVDFGNKFGAKKQSKTFQFGNKMRGKPAKKEFKQEKKINKHIVPDIEEGVIRIVPLGGVEEIGRNMTSIEFGDDIIVIDAGLQMKTIDTPGVDYIIPNTTYLEERKDKIRGMIVTHGHLDHIGAIPYIMERIGNPTIYSRYLTTIMIQKRQEEFPMMPKLKVEIIENDMTITLGKIKVRFFGVTHTIPDSMGVIIDTPYGAIVNPGDFKLDHVNGTPDEKEEREFGIFEKEKVLCLMADSTNVENPGFSTPEYLAQDGLAEIIKRSTGRLFIGTFASQMNRMTKIIEVAEGLGKKVVIDGRSMKTNIEVLKIINRLNVKKDTLITVEEMDTYPDSKIVALVTGAQGDEFGSLMRISNKSHKTIKLHEGDTIVLSASIIPGNEKSVEKLKDNLARQNAKIISYRTSDVYVHSTGHGNHGELEWMHKKVKPKFFIPIHGNHYRLKLHKDLAVGLGMPKENAVVPDNGSLIEIFDNGEKIRVKNEKTSSQAYVVDGNSIGDNQDIVMRDRQMLAADGMFVVVVTLDSKTSTVRKSADIISRGFVYLKENQELLQQVRLIVKKVVLENTKNTNEDAIEKLKVKLGENISKYLYQQTAKRPLVIPVVISI